MMLDTHDYDYEAHKFNYAVLLDENFNTLREYEIQISQATHPYDRRFTAEGRSIYYRTSDDALFITLIEETSEEQMDSTF